MPNDQEQNEIEKQIRVEKISRRENAEIVDSHVLLCLLKTILNLLTPSSRVLSTFQLEKPLATRSTTDMSGISEEVDNLYAAYLNNKDTSTLNLYREAKEKHNLAIVGIEHLWREISHLYQADRESYGKLTIIKQTFLLEYALTNT